MKTKVKISVLVLLMTVAFTDCTKDQPDIRDFYVATYSVTETWTENGNTISKVPFTMSIEKSSIYDDMVLLNNFANYGAGVTADATIDGFALTIKQQTLPNLKAITGTGTLANPTLNFTYTESYKNISIVVTAVAKKK